MPAAAAPLKIAFLSGSDVRLVQRMHERRAMLIPAIMRAMTGAMLRLQQYVVVEKLQGQVLQQRRGGAGLAGSVTAQPAQLEGGKIVGRVFAGGGPFWYAIVHERGGQKTFTILPVNKKALANAASGFGPVRKVVHPPLPKRAFMGPSLLENQAAITNSIRRAALEALK